jgi:hypothetical protein
VSSEQQLPKHQEWRQKKLGDVKRFAQSWRKKGVLAVGATAATVAGVKFGVWPLARTGVEAAQEGIKLNTLKYAGATAAGGALMVLFGREVFKGPDSSIDNGEERRKWTVVFASTAVVGTAVFLGLGGIHNKYRHDDASGTPPPTNPPTTSGSENVATTEPLEDDPSATTIAVIVPAEDLGGECSVLAPFEDGDSEENRASVEAVQVWLSTHNSPATGQPYYAAKVDQFAGPIMGAAVDQVQVDNGIDPKRLWDDLTCKATGPVSDGGLWVPAS